MYTTIDLCAGIGGIRRGFELTRSFKNVLSAEIDKYACQTYKHLFEEDPYNDITSDEFKRKVENIEYDVLLAGFPCQAFSRAGKEEGFKDATRGTLFFDIADIIQRTRPKSFLLENVDNLLSHDKGNTIKVILETLINELDYKIIGVGQDENGKIIFNKNSFLRNSRDFGIPQNRPRVYIIGFDKKRYNDLILNNSLFDEIPVKRNRQPIAEHVNQLLEFGAPAEFYIAQGYLNTLKEHRERHKQKGNGFGYEVINLPGKEKAYSNALLATGGSGKERNLVYDPQEGIAGRIVKGKQTPLNDEHIRHMTPKEWGKLQGFIGYAFVDENGEDQFSFPPRVSNTQLYKQFGNSVTIPVVEEMARYIATCLNFLEMEKEE